ncbi:MAG: hypothetical protein ACN4GZ_19420 [Acidimicrobiales bacterium]
MADSFADQLFLSTSSIEKYISSIFSKLDLTDEPEVHRRVAALLTFLQAHPGDVRFMQR